MARRSNALRQVVMAFGEREDQRSASIRGGKGAHLATLSDWGLRVPSGFTIATAVARAALYTEELPKRLEWQLEWAIKQLEQETGKRFGDLANPLMVSVRSGAEVSMPGMMDTILNLGMNRAICDELAKREGEQFARECFRRFLKMYGEYVIGFRCDPHHLDRDIALLEKLVPSDPRAQLHGAILAVVHSWRSSRAAAYRKVHGIPDHLGTAVTVQEMVFGNRNLNSGTGVVFSRNPNNGARGMYGEFLPCAQGEDVVSGSHTPLPLLRMNDQMPKVYEELESAVDLIEQKLGGIADVEFTVENGILYILQCRLAKLSIAAEAAFAVQQVWDKKWSVEKALDSIPEAKRAALTISSFSESHMRSARVIGRGIAASPGAAVGVIAFDAETAIRLKGEGKSVVLVRDETRPEDLLGMLVSKAIVTKSGGSMSHAAVVARSLGIPTVVGVGAIEFKEGTLSVCGTSGVVVDGVLPLAELPSSKEINIFRRWSGEGMPKVGIGFGEEQSSTDMIRLFLDFYLVDGMLNAARGSTLSAQLKKLHHSIVARASMRFSCYLPIAVASELRHTRACSSAASECLPELLKLENNYKIMETNPRGDAFILDVLKPMDLSGQIEFFRLAAIVFNKGRWGRVYGGPKWGQIAEAGQMFLSGKLKHAVFVDHVYDLRHNGGAIFDKHPMWHYPPLTKVSMTHLMDMRRKAHDISGLYQVFDMASRGGFSSRKWYQFSPSAEVLNLWELGVKQNLWRST